MCVVFGALKHKRAIMRFKPAFIHRRRFALQRSEQKSVVSESCLADVQQADPCVVRRNFWESSEAEMLLTWSKGSKANEGLYIYGDITALAVMADVFKMEYGLEFLLMNPNTLLI